MLEYGDPSFDPDIQDHLAREQAFDSQFAWPPAESETESRPRFLLKPWSIDREAALRSLLPPSAGDDRLDTALAALWLASHDEDEIILLRIQSLGVQFRKLAQWARETVLVSEREPLLNLVDAMFKAADENKTLPASGGSAGNAPRR